MPVEVTDHCLAVIRLLFLLTEREARLHQLNTAKRGVDGRIPALLGLLIEARARHDEFECTRDRHCEDLEQVLSLVELDDIVGIL